jgi:uncharacterized protein YcfJ
MVRAATWCAAMLVLLASLADAESRFADVRMATGRHGKTLFVHGEAFDEIEGVLVSDAKARAVRFEVAGASRFDASFDQLTAIHYEESAYPKRSPRRAGRYLVVHYTSTTGAPRFEIFRLPGDSADAIVAGVQVDTGMTVDRQPSTTSVLGLPIHVALGDTVVLTTIQGETAKGAVTEVTSTRIAVGSANHFDMASVRQIEIRDPVSDGAAGGAAGGAVVGLLGAWFSGDACECSGNGYSPLVGLVVGATVGAFIGAGIDRAVMRRAYRRTESSATPVVSWEPVASHDRLGLQVSIQF